MAVKLVSVTIKVPPKKNGKWSVAINVDGKHGHPFSRSTAAVAYRLLEGRLRPLFSLATRPQFLLQVISSYPDTTNEGSYDNPKDFYQALAAFLEDDLSKAFVKIKSRKYGFADPYFNPTGRLALNKW